MDYTKVIFHLQEKEKLESMEFVQSIADLCVFISADVVCLVYVDNALLLYRRKQAMESLKQKMRDNSIRFCDEVSVDSYLGVHIDSQKDSSIHLTQKFLVARIVEVMHLNDKLIDPVDTTCTQFLPINEFRCPAHE